METTSIESIKNLLHAKRPSLAEAELNQIIKVLNTYLATSHFQSSMSLDDALYDSLITEDARADWSAQLLVEYVAIRQRLGPAMDLFY